MNKKQWEIYYDALKLEDWEKALGALNKILKEDPKNSQVHLKIGDVFQKAGDKSNAIAAYNQSARLLIGDGFAHKAIAIFKIILRLDPENEEAIEQSEKLVAEFENAKKRHEPVGPSEPAAEEPLPESGTAEAPDFESSFSVSAEDFAPQVPFDQPETEPPHPREGFAAGSEFKSFDEQASGEDVSSQGEFGLTTETEGVAESPLAPAFPGQDETPDFSLPEEGVFGLDRDRGIDFEQPDSGGLAGYEEEGEPVLSPSSDGFFDREASEGEPTLSAPSFESEGTAAAIPGRTPSFLSFLPESESVKFTERAASRTFSPNEIVVREGGTGDSVFAIKSGYAKVVVHILGKEIELATLTAGDVFGEVAFLTGRPRTSSVIAVDDLEVIEFNKELLQEILEAYPDTLRKMDDFFQYHLHDTLDKVKARIKEK